MPKKKKQSKPKPKPPKDKRTLVERVRHVHEQANGNNGKPEKKKKPSKKKKPGISGKKAEETKGKTPQSGRNEKGVFVAGNSAGKGHGRPSAATEERLLTQLKNKLTPEKWDEMLGVQIGKACKGDAKAFESICKYCLPTPEQRLKIESQQQMELRVAGTSPGQIDAMYMARLLSKLHERKGMLAEVEGE